MLRENRHPQTMFGMVPHAPNVEKTTKYPKQVEPRYFLSNFQPLAILIQHASEGTVLLCSLHLFCSPFSFSPCWHGCCCWLGSKCAKLCTQIGPLRCDLRQDPYEMLSSRTPMPSFMSVTPSWRVCAFWNSTMTRETSWLQQWVLVWWGLSEIWQSDMLSTAQWQEELLSNMNEFWCGVGFQTQGNMSFFQQHNDKRRFLVTSMSFGVLKLSEIWQYDILSTAQLTEASW